MVVRTLTTDFWITALATAGWVVVSAWEYDLATSLFGEKGSRLATTLLMVALALTSGLLVLHHRRGDDDGRYWTEAELLYVMVLFGSLLCGVYSFLGWFFYA